MQAMTIGKKISLACVALVAFTIILGSVATFNISRISADIHLIVEGPLPGLYSLDRVQGYTKEQKLAMVEHIVADTPEQKSRLESSIADLESKMQAEMKVYEKTIQTDEGRAIFAKLTPLQQSVNRTWETILPLSRALKTKEAMAIWNGEALVAREERAKLFDEMLEQRRFVGDERGRVAIAASETATFWSILILVFSVASGGLLAFFIIRGINRALKQAVTELSEGAEQVSSAAGQVSGSSQSLAQGASEQAASLEETSASSEEINSMARKNSENSRAAAALATQAGLQFVETNRSMDQMVASMAEINTQSNKISKIIKVIDEIAFQTNILALNAAVEAARAGEAGMGFAVVADEVRSLAQRSAQAAKDTAALIEESIAKSIDGKSKVDQVNQGLRIISGQASQVKTLVDEVSLGSEEQTRGIEQIGKALSQMDQITQQTAASAEESASASEELNAQSHALMAVVQRLQAMVGTVANNSTVARKISMTQRLSSTRPTGNGRQHPAASASRKPVAALVSTRSGAEFPLDDSEFREF